MLLCGVTVKGPMSNLIAYLKLYVLSTFLLIIADSTQASEPVKLIFAVNSPGAAPYLYLDDTSNEYVGLVVDFFREMEKDKHVIVEYIDANRTRSEQFIYTGRADVFLSSLAWIQQPDLVVSSEELSPNRTFLYSTSPFDDDFELSSLTNERICTRRAYVYPTLAPLFDLSLQRVDSSSQQTGLFMLQKGRCDFSVMNQFNAYSLFNTADFCQQRFYRSPKAINSVPNALIFSLKNAPLIPLVNSYLQDFKASGGVEASLSQHMKGFQNQCESH